jgi:4-amino-4-deoxy-L-arabinose transferase-like glycosyltransferase
MNKFYLYIQKYWWVLVALVLLLGFFTRTVIPYAVTSFGYDQARDAQRISGIVYSHDFKLVGPETDIPGVFNGPLLYYMLAPVYAVSNFNPIAAVMVFVLLNLLTGFLIYITGVVLFKNRLIGLLALFFWGISFDQLTFSHYISNASLMGLGSVIFFLGLALYFLRKNNLGLPISILGLGMAIQFNFYLAYLLLFYGIFFYFYPRKHNVKLILGSVLFLLVLLSPFLIAELKWHFMMTKSLLSYVAVQGGIHAFSDSLRAYVDKLGEAIYYSFFSLNLFFGFLITVGVIAAAYLSKQYKQELLFISIWALSTLPLFGFSSGVFSVHVINLTILPALTILLAYGAIVILKNKKYRILGLVFILLLVLGNIKLLLASDFTRNTIVMSYSSEKQVIDYTYQEAQGKPFSICAITSPLFINTVWSYLYDHYGLEANKYLPFWAGPEQVINANNLPYDTAHTPLRFIIIESNGLSQSGVSTTIYQEDHASTLLQVKRLGEFTVQKRILQALPRKFIDTQLLTPAEASHSAYILSKEPRYTCYNTYSQKQ